MPHTLSHKYPIPISQLCLVNTDVPAGVGAPPLDTNSLNATGIYIRLTFTSRERERRIYTPALQSCLYRAKKRSLAALRGKSLLI